MLPASAASHPSDPSSVFLLLSKGAAHAQTLFAAPGLYLYTVGPSVTALDVTLAGGADEAAARGGCGGLITARLSNLEPGQVLRVIVGAGGDRRLTAVTRGEQPVRYGELSAITLASDTDPNQLTYLLAVSSGGATSYGSTPSPNGIVVSSVRHLPGRGLPGALSASVPALHPGDGYALVSVAAPQTATDADSDAFAPPPLLVSVVQSLRQDRRGEEISPRAANGAA